MAEINREWFATYGISDMTDEEFDTLSYAMMNVLSMRVGSRLSDMMDATQARAFQTAQSEEAQTAILEQVAPNYSDIVDQEFKKLGEEVRHTGKDALLKSIREL